MKNQFCKVGKITPNPTKKTTIKETKSLSNSISKTAYEISKTISFNNNCIAKPVI